MKITLNSVVLFFFLCAYAVRLVGISKRKSTYTKLEKTEAISACIWFLLGILWQIHCADTVGIIICIIGLVISEFTNAFVFYDDYKDKEIVYE